MNENPNRVPLAYLLLKGDYTLCYDFDGIREYLSLVRLPADTLQSLIVYYVPGGPTSRQRILVFDANKAQTEEYPYPQNAVEPSIRLARITPSIIILQFRSIRNKQDQLQYPIPRELKYW